MTILTILLFISFILFLIGYRKERSRRIALEGEVKSFADRKAYDINKLLEGAEKATKGQPIVAPIEYITPNEAVKRYGKPKAMTAPIVRDHPLANDSAMTAPIVKKFADAQQQNIDEGLEYGLKTKTQPEPKIPRGYKRHDGGKCPIPEAELGSFFIIQRGGYSSVSTLPPFVWQWKWNNDEYDIIAYKVVKPKTMKRNKK